MATKNRTRISAKYIPSGFHLFHALSKTGGVVYSMAWSPDGRMLASTSASRCVHLWDTQSGELLRTVKGDNVDIFNVVWSPDSRTLASGIWDKIIRLWNSGNGELLRMLRYKTHVTSLAWSPDGGTIATGAGDQNIYLCHVRNDDLFRTLEGHTDSISSLAWSPDGRMLASGSDDQTVGLWDTHRGSLLRTLRGHNGGIINLIWLLGGRILVSGSWDDTLRLWDVENGKLVQLLEGFYGNVNTSVSSPNGRILASSSWNETIHIWDVMSGRELSVLEGHTNRILCVQFSPDGRILASKSQDNTVRFWRCDTWELVAVLHEPGNSHFGGLAFHPQSPILATRGEKEQAIRLWELDYDKLFGVPLSSENQQYRNAKVILVGDSGVGKSGLGLVLTKQRWKPTASTHGRHVWLFDSDETTLPNNRREIRETLLWDLAGQAGYRMIHQLSLHDVTVALVVFDARSEVEPFSGVKHWDRALRQAQSVQGTTAGKLVKYLVAARADRGGIPVSRERIISTIRELGFDGFFETSAREGWQVTELIEAIMNSIDWNSLPIVSSTKLFQAIKQFLSTEKESGRLLSNVNDLYQSFVSSYSHLADIEELRAKFETCIGCVECRGLIRRLSFGNLVLLQPELLDAYASAMVNAARSEPDGLGFLPEREALLGDFPMPKDERITDKEQERLILLATVEELLRHELAFKEETESGTELIFPSQFTREWPAIPDVEGKTQIFTFEGPLLNIYATLVVRLSHSFFFKKQAMWKNASSFTANVGGTCGFYLRELEEGKGELTVFFDDKAAKETQYLFEEYISTHLQRWALPGSVHQRQVIICPICHIPVSELHAQKRLERGKNWMICSVCDTRLSLIERKKGIELVPFRAVAAIDRAANKKRDSEASLISARGEVSIRKFKIWAGSARTTLATVFTDMVGSTKLGVELGDESMNEVRRNHFQKVRELITHYEGYEIKNIGDAFFVAFRTAIQAFNFSLKLYRETGDKRVKIRAGIHVGPIIIEEEDAFGSTVNYTARVINAAKKDEIWVSSQAKDHISQFIATRRSKFTWVPHTNCELKGFPGRHTLWSVAL